MNKFLEAIAFADSIGISGHIRPDGDCFGSCMGLYNYIKEQFPEKGCAVYLEAVAPEFSFISRSGEVRTEPDGEKYALFISLDCGSSDRLGKFLPLFEGAGHNIVVDHHISNTGFGEENHVDLTASSTSEIIYTLLEEEKISRASAEALYLGIIHDTGVFKHSCTTRRTMEIAGRLMDKGVPYSWMIDATFYQKTYVQNQILGRCLMESVLMLDGKVIASVADQSMLKLYGAGSHDLDGVIDQLRVTEGVEAAILIHETEDHAYKVSLRANGDLDVSKIAVSFGGGGHKKAAGCTIEGSSQEVLTKLCRQIEAALWME